MVEELGSPELSGDDSGRPPETDAEPTSDPVFKLSESPAHLLRRAQQLATDIFSKSELSDNVTLRQSVVLAAIAESEGLSQSHLVNATGIDRSTLADMIARMQERGLVNREAADNDGRAKSVSLTASGRTSLSAALPALLAVDKALLETLTRNRRDSFVRQLMVLADAADERGVVDKSDAKDKKKKKNLKGGKDKPAKKKKKASKKA